MTLSETRKLGIEFERRVQTMIPEKEYLDKLDTETIYAYLNSYQDKYIHDIYRNLDNIGSGTKLSAHVESILQEMLRTLTISIEQANDYTGDINDSNGITIIENGRSVTYPLDPSFYMYIRSVSNVTSSYAFKSQETGNLDLLPIRIIPNQLVSQSDIWKLLETPHNSLRILRHPAASIGEYKRFGINNECFIVNISHSISDISGDFAYLKNQVSLDKDSYNEQLITNMFIYNMQNDTNDQITSAVNFLKGLSENDHMTFVYLPASNPESHFSDSIVYTITKTHNTEFKNVPTLNVIYDRYTTPLGIKIVYYAQPQRFDPMTSTHCELPMDAFDDLVTGAVDLYVQYVAGAEANKRRIDEARKQQAKQNNKKNNKEDED